VSNDTAFNNFGPFNQTFGGSSLLTLTAQKCKITSFVSTLPNVLNQAVYLDNNLMPSFNFNFLGASVKTVQLTNNPLTSLSNLSSRTLIEVLYISQCSFSLSTQIGTLPNGIRDFDASYNSFGGGGWTYNFSNLTYDGVIIKLKNCGLTTSNVNEILFNLASNTTLDNGQLFLNNDSVSYTNNQPPSTGGGLVPDGLAAKTTLEGRGWTVNIA
jgi:hypothetical protein